MKHPLQLKKLAQISCIAVSALTTASYTSTSMASSHREGPFITNFPKLDASDFYMFSKRQGFVTLIANYQPLQDAYGGPNYFPLDADAIYEIHIDNNGDGAEDITFQFKFQNTINDIGLPIGPNGTNVSIPLVNAGAITGASGDPLNFVQNYSVKMIKGARRGGTTSGVLASNGSSLFTKPLDYIGDKTFTSGSAYESYAQKYAYSDVKFGDCTATGGKVFVGQRKDPFALPLGKIFDLVNLDATSPGTPADNLANKNVTSITLEVPASCLLSGSEAVLGGWTTASVRQGRILYPTPTAGSKGLLPSTTQVTGGPWVQVSRLGNPLVNELVIGLKDKDRFNASRPKDDGQFLTYVQYPTLPYLIEATHPEYKAAIGGKSIVPSGVRDDLVAIFLTGIAGINQPKSVKPAEVLRFNTSAASGFPNGRNPEDDIVDTALQAIMGAFCKASDGSSSPIGASCQAVLPKSIVTKLSDGVPITGFSTVFPYLLTPISGSK